MRRDPRAERDNPMPAAPAQTIVDDHAIVRQGLAASARETDFTVVAEAGTYEEGFAALAQHNPDCVILDLPARPQRPRLDRAPAPTASPPKSRPSMHDEITFAPKALQAGAQGYVMKDQAEETLVAALRHVLAGQTHVSPAVQPLLADPPPAEEKATRGIESLTAREAEILYAIGGGLTTREIAEQFNLSGRTVDVHRANIKRKLDCASLAEVLIKAADYKRTRDESLLPPQAHL